MPLIRIGGFHTRGWFNPEYVDPPNEFDEDKSKPNPNYTITYDHYVEALVKAY